MTHTRLIQHQYIRLIFVCFEVLTVVLLKIRLLDPTDKGISIVQNGSTTQSHIPLDEAYARNTDP